MDITSDVFNETLLRIELLASEAEKSLVKGIICHLQAECYAKDAKRKKAILGYDDDALTSDEVAAGHCREMARSYLIDWVAKK